MCAIFSPPGLDRCRSASGHGARAKGKTPYVLSRAVSAPASFQAFPSCCRDSPEPAHRPHEWKVVNWNVAAPNNNPFEYWATHDDDRYNTLMKAVQDCIDDPQEDNITVGDVFTNAMFMELKGLLAAQRAPNLEKLEHLWTTDIKPRRVVRGFLKDTSFGEKRLISMPDRMTNSIKTECGMLHFRPSPISGSEDDLSDIPTWWALWKDFMFNTPLCKSKTPFTMLDVIPRAKYPALSEEEEAISIPLQTLCLAVFDAIFTHLLLKVAGTSWQPLKRSLHKALFENKTASCVSILHRQYPDADVVFIQEGSQAFAAAAAEACLDHAVLRPAGVDFRRPQISLILVRRAAFDAGGAREVTDEVLGRLNQKCVQKGDLCLFEVAAADGQPCLLGSFHGDSDGKSTAPVLAAIDALARERYPAHTLVVGLDANTAASAPPSPSHAAQPRAAAVDGAPAVGATAHSPAAVGAAPPALTVGVFTELLAELALGSCWGEGGLDGVWTTFNARTHLQPQLHKAVGLGEVLARRHMQLKDWIVFRADRLAVAAVARDNTGRGGFVEAVMPSLGFPSDHALVAATLRLSRRRAVAGHGAR